MRCCHSTKVAGVGLFGLTHSLFTMKRIFRDLSTHSQYDESWRQVGYEQQSFRNLNFYPIKYAEKTLRQSPANGLILELGCGLGRVVMHYHDANRKIIGLEYNEYALAQIKKNNPGIPLVRADARHLPFKDNSFDVVLAFGLYHGIENGVEQAVRETAKTIKPRGLICATSRIHNFLYYLYQLKYFSKKGKPRQPVFFKWAFKEEEWASMFSDENFSVLSVHPAFKTPMFYRLPFFRDKKCLEMNESQLRSYGPQLNQAGRILEKLFRAVFGWWFCDRIVVIAQKKPLE